MGAIVIASLAWLTGVVNSHTQSHLLSIQTDAAGVLLGEGVSLIQTPLTTAAAVAQASHGDIAAVERSIGADAGAQPRLFRSFSLWELTARGPVRLMEVGRRTSLSASAATFAPVVSRIHAPQELTVVDLHGSPPRLDCALEAMGTPAYVVLADVALPLGRHAIIPRSPAFRDLEFALYLGSRPRADRLLEATSPPPPVRGATASVRVPFGTTALDFVASPRRPLDGGLLPALPWIVGAVGAALLAAAAVTTQWLMRRRQTAELLARENLRLYAQQRSISEVLQNALLPKRLPSVPGIALAARYVPGDTTADIGGDWYDVVRCDDRSFLFAVGDVSGRGVPAASIMASLHYAIRAYAAQGDHAATILHKLTSLLDVARDGHFATVLLGHVDVPGHRLTLVNAGHLPPLVVSDGGAHFVHVVPGAPIGVVEGVRYVPYTVRVAPGSSVLAYTDGLVERRGELLDTGMARLQQVVSVVPEAPERLLDRVISTLTSDAAFDDVALLAMRWTE
ncbi:MAG: PP2C family protein-serine/threonine phosphatase [Actinomycetota bacterium]|nr:PP2C family protein-serine/threonine phosphatase [Actinomycetota bacterium]